MMKKLFYLLCLAFCLFGCSDNDSKWGDGYWDFIAYHITFDVTDSEGNNLLSPETPHNLLDHEIYVIYKGEKYPMKEITEGYPETREYKPHFNGLWVGTYDFRPESDGKGNMLHFGEFGPTYNYHREPFTLYWTDGTKYEIEFDLYITWKKKEPTVHKNVYVNGEKYPKDQLIIPIIK